MQQFNVLDWMIIAFFIAWILRGYVRGFISQLVSFVGLFIAYIAAYLFYKQLAPALAKMIPITSWKSYEQYELMINLFNLDTYFYQALAFGLIFFVVKIGLSVLSYVLNIISKAPGLNMLNKWGGLALAAIESIVLIVITVFVMEAIPAEGVQMLVADSYIAEWIQKQLPEIINGFQKRLPDDLTVSLNISHFTLRLI